jgi:hypothetical protein
LFREGQRNIVTSILDFYHKTSYERKKIAKATPNREVTEEMARFVGLPLEELPVLEGPAPLEVLVPLERTEEPPEPEESGSVLAVGREA